MRIVVTGALGHIGSRLIRDISSFRPDMEIVLVDNLSSQRYCSLFDLPAGARYRFIQADVVVADLKEIIAGASHVIHLAAMTDAASSVAMQEKVEQVNLVGTQRVARACAHAGAALLFLSTTSVYGTQGDTVDENCPESDLRPQSPYAESKLKAERYLAGLGASGGLRFVTCRFGTIFGTSVGMRFHTAINKFCWQAAQGIPLTVWRTAMDQVRPYLDLGDGVNAIRFILEKELFDGTVYNVLTLNSSVRSIVNQIQSYIPEVSVSVVDTPIMNQLSYHVLNDRFRDLGFVFKGDLNKGIAETLRLLKGIRPPAGAGRVGFSG